MPIAAIGAYLERLPAREAELTLLMADAAAYPHMKESHRKRALSGWLRSANAGARRVARRASPARLRMLGIGVKFKTARDE